MKRFIYILFLIGSCGLVWSQDSTFVDSTSVDSTMVDSTIAPPDTLANRSVMVERTFYPVIQNAGKINTPLSPLSEVPQPIDVKCSYYSVPLQTQSNFNSLVCAPTAFTIDNTVSNGYVQGALGHPYTNFDVLYLIRTQVHDMDIFAHHDGLWGMKQFGHDNVGWKYALTGKKVIFECDGDANLEHFTYYGRYYDGNNGLTIDRASSLRSSDKQQYYFINGIVGLRSLPQKAVQWNIRVGYHAFISPHEVVEHNIRTHFNLQAQARNTNNFVGLNFFMQNTMLQVDSRMQIDESRYNARHTVRIEPFYGYSTNKLRLHVGLNIDFNVGSGKQLSASKNLSFAPSLDVLAEYDLAPKVLSLFTNVTGDYGFKSVERSVQANPYVYLPDRICSHALSTYSPIDVDFGIHLRPMSNWLITLHADFVSCQNNRLILSPHAEHVALLPQRDSICILQSTMDFRRWALGVATHFHYRDVFSIKGSFDYYLWKSISFEDFLSDSRYAEYFTPTPNTMYDRPDWSADVRVDVHVTTHWTIYSDNHFSGKRKALTSLGDVELKANVDLDLGVQYVFNRWLSFYLQLNNYINRHNDIYYGYQSIGINGCFGVRWSF